MAEGGDDGVHAMIGRPGFYVGSDGFEAEDVVKNGNRFLIGNGYFGYRGTLEEFGADEMVALNLAGVYDQNDGKWRESVNLYNPLYTVLRVGSALVNPLFIPPEAHAQGIDMVAGIHHRDDTFCIGKTTVRVVSERFAGQEEKHLLVMKYAFTTSTASAIELITGIDGDVYDINGPHLTARTSGSDGLTGYLCAHTNELGIPVAVAETVVGNLPVEAKMRWAKGKFVRRYVFRSEPGKTYTIVKFAAVVAGEVDPKATAVRIIMAAMRQGYRTIADANVAWWQAKWAASDVVIRGDQNAQLGIRNGIYHLISIRPRDEHHSVAARGLSGQVYKGAVFWDTEMFILPFYLNTDPESARNCVMYRVHTLPGALRKAAQYGYQGAFYAWESQETGDDACSDYNVTDAVTGAPIRTYFKEQQIHITGDVAFAALRYFERTGDFSFLQDGGLAMLLECARFYLSYVRFDRKRDRYVVPGVIGPDEYHEGVNDNAYTNRLIRHTLEGTLLVVTRMRERDNEYVKNLFAGTDYASVVRGCRSVIPKLFVPQPDERGLIEQFAGYFALEDAAVAAVKARVKHPNEYLGGPSGVVTPTQVIKQADVITMLALFRNDHLDRIKKANWYYYEPRTEHGSSLSASMYALVASDIGESEYSYPLFLKSALIDILGEGKAYAGGIYIGGTHPAASGGAYLTAVYGFAGLKHDVDGLRCDAHLPKAVTGITFSCRIGKKTAHIDVTKIGGTVTWNQ